MALAESCISNYEGRNISTLIGAEVDLAEFEDARLDALLFGEANGRVIISTSELDAVKVVERAKLLGVSAARIGVVGGESLKIKSTMGECTWEVSGLHDLWWNAISNAMA